VCGDHERAFDLGRFEHVPRLGVAPPRVDLC
jgi:hypothetical protein